MNIKTAHVTAMVTCLLLFSALGCKAFLGDVARGTLEGMVEVERMKRRHYTPRTRLMLYGGKNNKQYLGCISCSEYETDSITNEYGKYGSRYATNSIWNVYGTFGSQYSQYSWRNPYATNPPVIVDQDGDFYGHFTVNEYFVNRTRIGSIVAILDAADGD